ncbi:MAG: hypothetical protein WED04_09115 [Promethearchaeati archaeon SRVP18_Atabeyarchaeia-1]
MSLDETKFKASVVLLILNGKPEDALEQLAKCYGVSVPEIKVGLPKGHRKNVLGCYTARDRTISILNSEVLKDPLVVLHEFYHHLRTRPSRVHRGTEKNATGFAMSFIESYKSMMSPSSVT